MSTTLQAFRVPIWEALDSYLGIWPCKKCQALVLTVVCMTLQSAALCYGLTQISMLMLAIHYQPMFHILFKEDGKSIWSIHMALGSCLHLLG
jgi:hypothetical protein